MKYSEEILCEGEIVTSSWEIQRMRVSIKINIFMNEIEWDWYAAEYQINIKIREGKGQKDKKWINLFKSTKLNFYASTIAMDWVRERLKLQ